MDRFIYFDELAKNANRRNKRQRKLQLKTNIYNLNPFLLLYTYICFGKKNSPALLESGFLIFFSFSLDIARHIYKWCIRDKKERKTRNFFSVLLIFYFFFSHSKNCLSWIAFENYLIVKILLALTMLSVWMLKIVGC